MNLLYIIFPKQLTKRATLLAAFVFLAFSLCSLTHKALAYNTGAPAISSNAPQNGSANLFGSSSNVRPWMSVGTGAYEGPNSYAKVYVPVGTGATLTITNGGGYCTVNGNGVTNSLDVYSPGSGQGYPNVWYRMYNLTDHEGLSIASGAPPPGGFNTPSVAAGTLAKSMAAGSSCKDLTLKFPSGIPSVFIGHQGYKVYYFEAEMQNPHCTSPGVCDTEKSFKLSINNGGLVGFSRHIKGYPVNEFGIYLRNAPYLGKNNWDFATQFAPRCDENPSGTRSVNVRDIDRTGGFPQPSLTGQVQQDNRGNSSYSWSLTKPGKPISQKITTDWSSGNNTVDQLTFKINGNSNRYLLEFKDIYFRNTIQIELPYDEFDASTNVHCNPTAKCAVNPLSQNIAPGGTASITVTGTMTSGPWPSTYYIERSSTSFAGYKQITAQGVSSGVDTSSPPVTVTYNYFVASSNPLETENNQAGGPVINGDNCQATVVIVPPSIIATATPYFQVWQNDAAAGGGFKTKDIACPGSTDSIYPTNVGYVSPTTTGNDYRGGIIANSASGSPYQSKSDFGAVALGYIPITPGINLGFNANVGTTSGPSLRTWFANTAGSEGHLSKNKSYHCVKDYYNGTRITSHPQDIGSLAAAITWCDNAGLHSCQFNWTGGPDLAGITPFPSHHQITIYVDGNITIGSNISYSTSFDPKDPADVPYFSLIAQGNITLKDAVRQLDGLYVAQPKPIGNGSGGIITGTGVFNTCNNDPCNNQLVVNGAVIAQHVKLLRAHGSSNNLSPDPWPIGNAPAEIFNFVPSMVLGVPAFVLICQEACMQGYSIAPVF